MIQKNHQKPLKCPGCFNHQLVTPLNGVNWLDGEDAVMMVIFSYKRFSGILHKFTRTVVVMVVVAVVVVMVYFSNWGG